MSWNSRLLQSPSKRELKSAVRAGVFSNGLRFSAFTRFQTLYIFMSLVSVCVLPHLCFYDRL